MSVLELENLSHAIGDRVLYQKANFSLNKGEHVGLVGVNGSGKSTLLKIITGDIVPDAGFVRWQKDITVACLDQYAAIDPALTVQAYLRSAFAYLDAVQEALSALYAAMAEGDTSSEMLNQAASYQETLEREGFYEIEARIAQVAQGLGLAALGYERPVAEMSGGQRAKLILGKLLLTQPDVLLLDEPTNFLDKAHVDWLADTLMSSEKAFIVVSHDETFLQRVCNRICDIDEKKLRKYDGTYSEFLKKKTFLREDYIRKYAAQQREIKKTEAFIRKNIAGRNAKMARGRQKQLNRLERMEALSQKEVKPSFQFSALPFSAREMLVTSQLVVGYQYPLLQGIDFRVKGGQKIVMTGFNGIGKSTLLKTLVGHLSPISGSYHFSEQVRVAYFAQELSWRDATQTPLQIVHDANPHLSRKNVRQHLAQCGLSSALVEQPIGALSGGEQVKVKLCLLGFIPCNFLILDEPTNHLDRLAKMALQEALQQFQGTVLLVSHEEAFYRGWIDEIIDITKSC